MHGGRKGEGEVKGSMEEFEGRRRGILTTGNGATKSATFVKGVEWGLDTRGLRMVVAFWTGIPVEVT